MTAHKRNHSQNPLVTSEYLANNNYQDKVANKLIKGNTNPARQYFDKKENKSVYLNLDYSKCGNFDQIKKLKETKEFSNMWKEKLQIKYQLYRDEILKNTWAMKDLEIKLCNQKEMCDQARNGQNENIRE